MTSTKISSEESGGIAYFIKKGIIGILNIVKGVGIMISNGRIISVTYFFFLKKYLAIIFKVYLHLYIFLKFKSRQAKLDYFQPIK